MLEDLRDYGLVWQSQVRLVSNTLVFNRIFVAGIVTSFQSHKTCDDSDVIGALVAHVYQYRRCFTRPGLYRSRD